VFKPRKCRECKATFKPSRAMQPTCSLSCHLSYADKVIAKSKAKQAKEDKANDRQRKEALKTRGEWVEEAEKEVRKYRRLQELAKGEGCISCKRPQQEVQGTEGWKPGGAWDAGHFLSKGARPELRMEPLNIWLQCKSCNAGSSKYARKGYTVGQDFEANLRAKQGDALVDWLKGPHEPKHYSIDDLKAIKTEYRAKARELQTAAESA
jgi:hypothetical protein